MRYQSNDIDESVLLSALMDNVADSIYFKDRDCRLVWVSLKLVTDLGYSEPSQILGKTDVDLFGEDFGQKTIVEDLGSWNRLNQSLVWSKAVS